MASVPASLSANVNSLTSELMHHFHWNISGKLAWVDGPANPWRQVIIPLAWASRMVLDAVLALSSEDLAAKLQHDSPRRQYFHNASMHLRNRALASLATQIAYMSQETSLARLDSNQTQHALASALILYNVELHEAESAKWRLHLQAAREILQWKKGAFPQDALHNEVDSFLLYEQYYANVFAGLTSFDVLHESTDEVQYPDSTAFFADFVNIINRLTRIERLSHNQIFDQTPTSLEKMVHEANEAKHRMIQSSEVIPFQTGHARISFQHLVCIFHGATLIYIHQILAKDLQPDDYLQSLRDSILDHLESLTDKVSVAHDLVWPLFIAGTECRGLQEKQAFVARELETVMQISGTLDRRKVLEFLLQFWSQPSDSSIAWIQLMRQQAPSFRMLIL